MRLTTSRPVATAIAILVLAACTGTAETSSTTTTAPPTTTIPTTTTTTLADCSSVDGPLPNMIEGESASEISVAVSNLRFECANAAVVTSDSLPAIQAGAALGLEDDEPVLVNGDGTVAELERLGARSVRWVGPAPAPDFGIETSIVSPADIGTPASLTVTDPPALWVLGENSDAAPILRAAAAARGEAFVDITAFEDLRTVDREVMDLFGIGTIVTVGLDENQMWQLGVVRAATELPGGGFTFDGKRLVAFYGNPTTSALGVLGEQDPAATLERLRPIVEDYSADGLQGIPTFEIIATVASSRAGADNDYSDEAGIETLRPWIDFAAANGVYVVLDLQPGRTDFLTQAQRYEEFLRLPHVGLALDPEWRLKPNQVHLRQIGTVDATEINQVSAWLAEIVREEQLPQKYFLVHQFHFSMITNRELIETPTELFTVIQMDGQGPLHTKYETYGAITAGQEDAGWAWGWKNFYDEDNPMGTPAEVLAVEPVVVFVSFQ
ncbi:MAG: hypothetical protein WD532_05545 [Acidimicrobiia bacterium]